LEQIELVREKNLEDKLWGMYLTKYAYMTEKTFNPFEKFFVRPAEKKNVSRRSSSEILTKVARINRKFNERRD
jgi:hypothetical protein